MLSSRAQAAKHEQGVLQPVGYEANGSVCDVGSKFQQFNQRSGQASLESKCAGEKIDRSAVRPASYAESLEFPNDEKANSVNQPGYTLPDIEQIAMANNPTLTAAQAAICKAAGLKNQIGILPNPTVGYFGQQLAAEGTAQNGLFIEREFVRGDKLRLNRQVLSHTSSAQQRELEAQQYRVLTDVRIRFYEAIAAQQKLETTRSLQATAQRGVEIAGDRLQAEEGSRIDVLQSETLLSEITLAVERAEIAFRAAWNDLAAVAGLTDNTPGHLVGELVSSQNVPDWLQVYNQIVQQSPELSVARELVCEKAALLRRQQVQAIPNVTGHLAAGVDSGTDSGMINVQVSAPIPVSNKNWGNISAANADYMQAVENVKRIEQSLKSRMARVAQEYQSSLAAVNKYENEIIPQSALGLELSEEAYQAGELDFLQVLILRRSYFESMIRLIESKSQLAQAAAKIDGLLLTGGLDAPQDYTVGDGLRGDSFGGQ
jgi:cobalt-zinc-cadmium efflux system outer membrane protein